MDDGRKREDATVPATQPPASRTRALGAGLYGRAYPLLALTTFAWGGNAVAARLAVGEISPMLLTTARWAIVLAILLPFVAGPMRSAWPAIRADLRYLVPMAALGFTSFNAMLYIAASYTGAINITILQGAIPILVLLGARLVYGTRVTLLQILGMGVTLVGVAAVAAQGDLRSLLALRFNPGDVLMVVACVLYAGYTLGLRRRPPLPPLVFFGVMAVIAFLTSLPLAAIEFAMGATVVPGRLGLGILLYVALMPSLLAQLFFMRGVELIGPGRAGLFVNLVPVFGALLAVLVLAEPFRLYHALALALVLGGIALAEKGKG